MYNQKKYFKIEAKMSLYSHIYVEAKNEDEARELAENIDGGDFLPDEDAHGEQVGAWEIWNVEECTEVPPANEISDVKADENDLYDEGDF
jgi:hypothetical protein